MPSAISARRWTLILAPPIAGVLTIVGVLADPAPGVDGRELIEEYAANPERLHLKALGYHFAYTLWLAAALGLALLVRRRGAWIANAAVVLAILGISTIPGFLIGDFVDSAIGRLVSIDAAVLVGEDVEDQWGFLVMAIPGFLGLLLALPLAAIAAWRAAILPWWGAAAVVLGKVAFVAFNVTLPGNVILAVAFAVFAVAIARIDPSTWGAPDEPSALSP